MSFIRDLTTSGNGFTVNDVLETDFETLFKVLNSGREDREEEVQSLESFILSSR